VNVDASENLFILYFLGRRGWERLQDNRPQAITFCKTYLYPGGGNQHVLTIDTFYGYERYQLSVTPETLPVYVSGK
jgi:hypothetical protein